MSYPKDNRGVEIYPLDNNTGDFLYLTNAEGIQIPAKDENGLDFYATKNIILSDGTKNKIEYPPIDTKNQKPLYITKSQILMKSGKEEHFEIPVYPMNITTGNPIYEKTPSGDEKYFFNSISGNEFYGMNIYTAEEVYAKDKTGKEIFNDINEYAKNIMTQEERYPRYNDGNEYYKVKNLVEIPARDAQSNVKYARLVSGEEIYPQILKDEL